MVCAIGAYTHGGCTRYWDLAKGERTVSLTNHKKSVRALAIHPYEFTHASASADNIKKWKFPRGEFLMNMRGQNAIINAMSVNQENGTPPLPPPKPITSLHCAQSRLPVVVVA